MRKPTPKLVHRDGELRWYVDARAMGLGQYTLKTPGVQGLAMEAMWEAVELIRREQEEREAKAAQGLLPLGGPRIAEVMRSRADEREFATRDGRKWARDCARRIADRFGATSIGAFAGLQGYHRAVAWRDELAREGLATRTRRNLLNELRGILRYAVERECGWLDELPRFPSPCLQGETLDGPEQATITEAEFRAIRACLYANHDHPGGLSREIPDVGERLAYIARRRLFLSWGFYTGMRVIDLGAVDDRGIAPDLGTYWRTGHKTGARRAAFDAPEALLEDVQAELQRLGRPFARGELICGGPWPRGSAALAAAAARAGVRGPVNFRSTLRRSCARELLIRGHTYQEVAHVLGHRSTAMLENVYAQIPPRFRSPVKVPWNRESTARLLRGESATAPARVLRIEPRARARRLHTVGEE
jgi:integrase